MSQQKHSPRGRIERKIAPSKQVERHSPREAPRGRDAARPSVQPKESRVSVRLATIFRMMDEGFAILPLVEGGKTPANEGGVTAASKNKAAVDRWFQTRPGLNYGIATGARSRIFVLDVDGPEGKASLCG